MKSLCPYYEIINHTADLGMIIKGKDLPTLFKNAGIALMDIMVSGNSFEAPQPLNINITGTDLPDLMVRWLGEVLYIFEGEGLVTSSININSISHNNLDASVLTAAFDSRFHKVLREIKAVTYHLIEVVEKAGVWEARVIFDL